MYLSLKKINCFSRKLGMFFGVFLIIAQPILAEPSHSIIDATIPFSVNNKRTVRPLQLPQALLFISFSMPDGLIESILKDAKRFQIPVYIRGLIDNDFKKTMAKLFELQKKTQTPVLIDPLIFKTFNITCVPALVVMRKPYSCQAEVPCDSNQFELFSGNLSITDKLKIIANQSMFAANTAKSILKRAGESV